MTDVTATSMETVDRPLDDLTLMLLDEIQVVAEDADDPNRVVAVL